MIENYSSRLGVFRALVSLDLCHSDCRACYGLVMSVNIGIRYNKPLLFVCPNKVAFK